MRVLWAECIIETWNATALRVRRDRMSNRERIIYSVDHGKLVVYVIDANSRGTIYKRY